MCTIVTYNIVLYTQEQQGRNGSNEPFWCSIKTYAAGLLGQNDGVRLTHTPSASLYNEVNKTLLKTVGEKSAVTTNNSSPRGEISPTQYH